MNGALLDNRRHHTIKKFNATGTLKKLIPTRRVKRYRQTMVREKNREKLPRGIDP
jgi:hypothetical protein